MYLSFKGLVVPEIIIIEKLQDFVCEGILYQTRAINTHLVWTPSLRKCNVKPSWCQEAAIPLEGAAYFSEDEKRVPVFFHSVI